jgi:hypothetical protein
MIIPLYLLNQTAKLKIYVGNNSNGEPVYGTAENLDNSVILAFNNSNGEYTIRCRLEPTKSSSRQPGKESISFRATLFTLGSDIPTLSKVIIDGDKYTVGDCIKRYGLNGLSHIEVLLT